MSLTTHYHCDTVGCTNTTTNPAISAGWIRFVGDLKYTKANHVVVVIPKNLDFCSKAHAYAYFQALGND